MKNELAYPHLFSPIQIGDVIFKNRIWSAPAGVHLLSGTEPYPNDHVIAYYAEKAKGGVACITYSAQNMDFDKPEDLIHAAEDIRRPETHRFFSKLVDGVHFYGAKISLELLAFAYHGFQDSERVEYSMNGDGDTLPLDRAQMERIAQTYADVAESALACGFDMLLIHAGHGLVVSQFFSPILNKRTDEFGAQTYENRVRFLRMILDAIRERVGRKLLIELRISGEELPQICDQSLLDEAETGYTVDDCTKMLELLEDAIDIAHISTGMFYNGSENVTHPNYFLPEGCNAYLARQIRQSGKLHIPVLTLGGFSHPEAMEQVIANGEADMIAMARGLISDASRVNLARDGRADEAIPCIRCFHCLDYRNARTFGCSVNPKVGRELELETRLSHTASIAKKVVIIGGGPAGLKAAITAAEQGHSVTLLEKNAFLGGKIALSDQMGFKNDLKNLRDHLVHMTAKYGVDCRTGIADALEEAKALKPDVLIVATGAVEFIPDIPGLSVEARSTITQYFERLSAGEAKETHVLVLGGGLAGCETALCLQNEYGKQVTLVESTGTLAKGEMYLNHDAIVRKLHDTVDVKTNTFLTQLEGTTAYLAGADGSTQTVSAEHVVIATGSHVPDHLLDYYGIAKETYVIGDAAHPSNVRNALRTAFDTALSI